MQPRFSWRLDAGSRNQQQTAYRILISKSLDKLSGHKGDIWDSGKIGSDASHLIKFTGKPLEACQIYWWKVQIWHEDHVSDWSVPVSWETGIFGEASWRGNWIAAPDSMLQGIQAFEDGSIPLGKWVWPDLHSRVYLRKSFKTRSDMEIKQAVIQVQCDNEFEFFLNGSLIPINAAQGWIQAGAVDISGLVAAGHNDIAIKAYQTADPARFSAALRFGLKVIYPNGDEQHILSDEGCKVGLLTEFYRETEPDNWQTADIADDRSWDPGFIVNPRLICQDIHPRLTKHSLYMRKDFQLEGQIASARAYVTARGLYEFHLNGQKLGKGLLYPGISEKYQYYQVFDIKDWLQKGSNTAAFISGNGWYNRSVMANVTALKNEINAQIVVTLTDGRSFCIVTDSTWKVHESPIIDNDLHFGERYDARLELRGWNQADFDASLWNNAIHSASSGAELKLKSQPFEDVEIEMELKAVQIDQPAQGVHVFDFGQNASGRCRLHLKAAQPGEIILIKYGEMLNEEGFVVDGPYNDVYYPSDDEIHGKSPYMKKNSDCYISRGDDVEDWEPRFTYTGFRYVQISGYSGIIDSATVIHRVFNTNAAVNGRFECGNELLNNIWKAAAWTFRSNLHYGPTDCPTREKSFWNGDIAAFIPTACWYSDVYSLMSEWTEGGRKLNYDPVAWEDEILVLPWTLYNYYKDMKVLEDNYEKMTLLMDSRIGKMERGLYFGDDVNYCGDHCSVEQVPKAFFNSAYSIHSLDLIAQIAAVLGQEEDERKYRFTHNQMVEAFNREFMGNSYYEKSMGALLMPLVYGLLNEEKKRTVLKNLEKELVRHSFHPTTGFVCTPFLLPVLTEGGFLETAWKTAVQTTYPSWGYMLSTGATTLTESWKGHEIATNLAPSMNHYAFGSIGQWFFECLAGIKLNKGNPGFKHFMMKPYLPAELEWVKCTYESIYGEIESSWRKFDNIVEWTVVIPWNTRADIYLPCNNTLEILESGKPLLEAAGIEYVGIREDRCLLRIGSGRYVFVMGVENGHV
ncbi:hypothetical protein EHS13_05160 [Paenibacillus psychroresistens]|uniref:alpha-L-rhamnosidase n=1 Tax=Paenibacillus psychroresistens TaxID=1778678 RepID=A0A6B8RFY7_9BACL|nr:alpha-L-rhamnosidase [Paenibacillus psychroresistens]QGQ94338.1 hypothetical protein EHS13_05160 [Paenibacillus psychroresistens]